MTIPAVDPHVVAVQALITTALAGTQIKFGDGEVPADADQMYTVMYADPGMRDRSTIRAVTDQLALTFQMTCVGMSAAQARRVLDVVVGGLVDHVPAVSGRTCWPITLIDGTPPVFRDDDARDPVTGRPRFVYTPRFRSASTV